MGMFINKKLLKKFDYPFLLIVTLIVGIGLLTISSATHVNRPENSYHYVKMQVLWFVLGLIVMIVVISFDYRILGKFAKVIYAGNILMLLSVFFIGKRVMGAQRWINLGAFGIQPSELAKIAIIITLAKHLEAKKGKLENIKDLIPIFIHIGVPMLLIMKQPDLGTSLVFIAILFGMLFIAGIGYQVLFGMLAVGVLSIPVLWNFLKDYQKKRILVFLNPNMDPLGSGYHVIQSMIAIGSGRLMGKGIFKGTQNQLDFLPEQHTDFIFSVLGEELGFIGGFVLLFLFFLLIMRGLHLASQSKDVFGMLIIIGVISMFTFHVLVNIGMTMGIMPVTGLPLPFMSYGGSSMLTNMIAVGLVLNVGMRRSKILF